MTRPITNEENTPGESHRPVLTLVFTDIEKHTSGWNTHGDPFKSVLERHNALLCSAAHNVRGEVIKYTGDGLFLVFEDPTDAVQFAVDAQRALRQENWKLHHPDVTTIRVRIGIDTGTPVEAIETADYFGKDVCLAARVMDAAHGEQILISDYTNKLVSHQFKNRQRFPDGITFKDCGAHDLKDFPAIQLWQVCQKDLRDSFEPRVRISIDRKRQGRTFTSLYRAAIALLCLTALSGLAYKFGGSYFADSKPLKAAVTPTVMMEATTNNQTSDQPEPQQRVMSATHNGVSATLDVHQRK